MFGGNGPNKIEHLVFFFQKALLFKFVLCYNETHYNAHSACALEMGTAFRDVADAF